MRLVSRALFNNQQTRDISTPPKFDYPRLHDLARHIIHSSETLLIAIKAISSIILSCEEAAQQNPSFFLVKESVNIKNCLRFQVSMLHAVKSRSTALEERLRNEINLVSSPLCLLHLLIKPGISYCSPV
jgi:hypothetical protein